jgi:hypothetical protein
MPKSRGRKPKNRHQKNQAIAQTKKPSQLSEKSFLIERILESWPVLLIGAAAALFALYDATLTPPEISAKGDQDASYPFALPFEVKNSSRLFTMRRTKMFCGIDKVTTKNGISFEAFSVLSPNLASIEPKEEAAFRCVLSGTPNQRNIFSLAPGDAIDRAHILIRLEYKTLWFSRQSSETEFTWYTAAKPPRWVRGKIIE